MTVPLGYQKTEVGIIPVDWSVVAQSSVATFYNGRAYKITEWEEHGTPVIRLQNLTGTGKDYYYSNLKLPDHQYVNKGDLLYMWSATFGVHIWNGSKAIYHYHIWKIELEKSKLDKQYMYYHLDNLTERMKGQSNGSTMLHITKGGMEKQNMVLPPLFEQKKIARILTTIDKKLENIEQKIAATQQLKKGLMQKLFSEGAGLPIQDADGNITWQPHTEFEESELGRIPNGWEVKKLDDVADFFNGKAHEGSVDESGDYIIVNSKFVSTEGRVKKFTGEQLCSLEIGDLSLVMSDIPKGKALGKCYRIKENNKYTLNQRIGGVRATKIDDVFLFYYLNRNPYYLKFDDGVSQTNLRLSEVINCPIPLPSRNEQKRIANILLKIDEKIKHILIEKEEIFSLKKGLMQKLLTGQWRVKIDEQDQAS